MADKDTILCVITDPYPLPIRGGVNGPILVPSKFTVDEIRHLLVARFHVFAVNPHNKKERTQITFRNLGTEIYPPVKKERVVSTKRPASSTDKVMGAKKPTVFQNRNEKKEIQEMDIVDSPDFF